MSKRRNYIAVCDGDSSDSCDSENSNELETQSKKNRFEQHHLEGTSDDSSVESFDNVVLEDEYLSSTSLSSVNDVLDRNYLEQDCTTSSSSDSDDLYAESETEGSYMSGK
jgi:hypothetical protein